MSQFLTQVPRQALLQQQRLTPQLIQAMDILQLSVMALEERIAQELDGNPALELAPADDDLPGEPPAGEREDRPEGEQALVVDGDARDFERLDSLAREYDWSDEDLEYRPSRSRAAGEEAGQAKLEAMANTEARPGSLQDHLLEQWQLLDLHPDVRRVGTAIIESLDATGRLSIPLEEIAGGVDPPAALACAKDALARVQRLEPAGIGARDVRECLILQLEAAPYDADIEICILEEHFDELRRNRLPQIAQALGVPIERVKSALSRIGRLSLHPGLGVTDRGAPPVVPDVIVELDEQRGEYEVRLARGNQRELRIAPEFRAALQRAAEDKAARDFVRQKIDAAAAIIDAVRYRRERLLEVSRRVFEVQRDFLDRGEEHIRVLRMSDLAAQLGCDASTISRTVDGKYVQTPRGIYPLRRFFTGGTESGSGEVIGWDSVKAKVQAIVAEEDKSSPLSDDEIVQRLGEAGIDIKRRTVAKYRSQLNIPTARQRRQY